MRAELETVRGPCVEVVGGGDGAAGALGLADRPVLVEGARALDGGLVDPLGAVDVVGGAVRDHGAEAGGAGGRVVGAEVLDDVVLDQGVGGPAVDREVAVAVGVVGARVRDRSAGVCQSWWEDGERFLVEVSVPGRARLPSLATDEVAAGAPGHGV